MIRVLGIKMAKMTPSRGYSSELAVALVVAVFVYFGLPISTTHCIVSELSAYEACSRMAETAESGMDRD